MVRLAVAGNAPLSADEAYYWVWSRALAPGYLDHPPMVALWIWVGTALVGDGALGVRLLGPVSGLIGAGLLVQTGQDLFGDRRRGLIAALLLNATLLLGIGTVTMTLWPAMMCEIACSCTGYGSSPRPHRNFS